MTFVGFLQIKSEFAQFIVIEKEYIYRLSEKVTAKYILMLLGQRSATSNVVYFRAIALNVRESSWDER